MYIGPLASRHYVIFHADSKSTSSNEATRENPCSLSRRSQQLVMVMASKGGHDPIMIVNSQLQAARFPRIIGPQTTRLRAQLKCCEICEGKKRLSL